jgi:general secretion pathway protein G
MEIMIVVVIIGLVSSIVGVNVYKYVDKARAKTAQAEVKTLKDCVGAYYADTGEFPRTLEDLVTDPGNPKWDGPYPDPPKIPKDPWGEDYHYDCPGQHGDFDIYSYGKDKAPGGEKLNADITSWE